MMYLGRASEVVVLLHESNYEFGYEGDTVGASGVVFSDITVKYWKPGLVALQELTITNADWIELGNGYYAIKIPASVLNTVGFFFLQISGPYLRVFSEQYSVEPTPVSFLQSPNLCIVHGNITDITGSALNPQDEIVFHIYLVPKSTQGSIINSNRIVTKPDVYGNFSIQLLRNIDVKIEIKVSGINFKFKVPDAPVAALLDLMPPF